MNIFLLIVLISVIEYIGDSNFKIYTRTNNKFNLYLGISIYLIMIGFVISALRSANVAYVNGMWDGTSALIETLLAFILLHESFSNNIQYLGLLLIICGIFALNYGPIPNN